MNFSACMYVHCVYLLIRSVTMFENLWIECISFSKISITGRVTMTITVINWGVESNLTLRSFQLYFLVSILAKAFEN